MEKKCLIAAIICMIIMAILLALLEYIYGWDAWLIGAISCLLSSIMSTFLCIIRDIKDNKKEVN